MCVFHFGLFKQSNLYPSDAFSLPLRQTNPSLWLMTPCTPSKLLKPETWEPLADPSSPSPPPPIAHLSSSQTCPSFPLSGRGLSPASLPRQSALARARVSASAAHVPWAATVLVKSPHTPRPASAQKLSTTSA